MRIWGNSQFKFVSHLRYETYVITLKQNINSSRDTSTLYSSTGILHSTITFFKLMFQVVTVETDAAGNTTSPTNVTITKPKSLLTGNPQKDYIYDPNLPRELNGYNLSSYPFYNGVPADIDFKCDDLHDGFYASVPHKCQVIMLTYLNIIQYFLLK